MFGESDLHINNEKSLQKLILAFAIDCSFCAMDNKGLVWMALFSEKIQT